MISAGLGQPSYGPEGRGFATHTVSAFAGAAEWPATTSRCLVRKGLARCGMIRIRQHAELVWMVQAVLLTLRPCVGAAEWGTVWRVISRRATASIGGMGQRLHTLLRFGGGAVRRGGNGLGLSSQRRGNVGIGRDRNGFSHCTRSRVQQRGSVRTGTASLGREWRYMARQLHHAAGN